MGESPSTSQKNSAVSLASVAPTIVWSSTAMSIWFLRDVESGAEIRMCARVQSLSVSSIVAPPDAKFGRSAKTSLPPTDLSASSAEARPQVPCTTLRRPWRDVDRREPSQEIPSVGVRANPDAPHRPDVDVIDVGDLPVAGEGRSGVRGDGRRPTVLTSSGDARWRRRLRRRLRSQLSRWSSRPR